MLKSTSHSTTLFTNLKLRHTPRVYFRFESATSCLSFSKQASYTCCLFFAACIYFFIVANYLSSYEQENGLLGQKPNYLSIIDFAKN
jgi:hypothetical protein